MSAYANFKTSLEYAEKRGVTVISRSLGASRHLVMEVDNYLAQMEKLKALVKNIPLQEGDVVQEVYDPLQRGDVIGVQVTEDETIYRVRNRHQRKTFVYSRDQLELIERPEL